MYTFKFLGLEQVDAETPYYYGSLPAKPVLGTILSYEETGIRYVVFSIEGEGLMGNSDYDDQKALAWAEVSRGEKVPTLYLQKLLNAPETRVQGQSFDCEELTKSSQQNREARLSAKTGS